MTNEELRVTALHQASTDCKHEGCGIGSSVSFGGARSGPPDAKQVVARAEVYLAFLKGPAAPTARKRK